MAVMVTFRRAERPKPPGGSGWESNPPLLALRDQPPILKTGATTGPQPLPPGTIAKKEERRNELPLMTPASSDAGRVASSDATSSTDSVNAENYLTATLSLGRITIALNMARLMGRDSSVGRALH